MKCTQKSPDRRYNSLAELISDLKQSLIDPDGNFVNLTPLSNHAQTVVISPEEMEQIKRGAVAAGNTVPESNPEVNYEDFEIPDEDEYIDNNADYDYKDDVDDYDAEEEEPHKKDQSYIGKGDDNWWNCGRSNYYLCLSLHNRISFGTY